MRIGRRILLGWPMVLWGERTASERLEGRWTARQPAARQKGRNAALLGFGFTKEGTFRIEEVSRVGALSGGGVGKPGGDPVFDR